MLADCLTKTKNSCRLNEALGTGIFDMKPQWKVSLSKPKTDSGEHRRKSKNDRRIPTIEMLIAPVLNFGIARLRHDIIEFDIAPVELLSTSEARSLPTADR